MGNNERSNEKKSSNRQPSTATRLVALAKGLGTSLFHDQSGMPFALISENGSSVAWPLSNRNFARWLGQRYYQQYKSTPSMDAIRQAVNVLEGCACFDGKQVHLHNRMAWNGETLYYDLSDSKGRAIKITTDGWDIVESPKVFFRRYEHQEDQVKPSADGDIKSILPFLNLQDEGQIPLELAYLVTCFVPGIPHPIHISYGPQGSAKSTQDRMKRRLVDPSANDIQTLTSQVEQTAQILAQNWFCPFDNVSYMNEETSDLLCRASTGASYSKRALYTDDETVIQRLGCCISLNGINVVGNKPDLMDRAILMEYARIPSARRREEKAVLADFERARAKILGGIFDVLALAIRLKPQIVTDRRPRMADFALWGMAASEAMGYGAEMFLELYEANIETQNQEVISSNPVGLAVMGFMEGKNEWEGTVSTLLAELGGRCEGLGIDKRAKEWPKAPHILTKRIKELETTLNAIGMQVYTGHTRENRFIRVSRVYTSEPQKRTHLIGGNSAECDAVNAVNTTPSSVRSDQGRGGEDTAQPNSKVEASQAYTVFRHECDGCPYYYCPATWQPSQAMCQWATRFAKDIDRCPLQ